MRFSDAVAALDARSNYERSGRLTSPTLDRMRALADVMANPERTFASLHITGTNGKTTVARAATEVLRAAGLSVGTYTSPHVESVRERFAFDGEPIPEDDFASMWEYVEPYLDLVESRTGERVTWFEAATALAFAWFSEKAVDVAVVEVGMGGAWDATNVIDSAVPVITTVGMDHADVLGPTLTDIAREKSGIIKPGATLFTASQTDEVAEVLRARCAEVGADFRAEGLAFDLERSALALGGQQISIRVDHDRYGGLFLPMFGEHLARDAVLGAAAARALLGDAALGEEIIGEAFANLRTPGRVEVVRRHPLVVLDGAHNADAARALAATMRTSFTWDRLWLVVSIMADKETVEVLRPLVDLADEVIVTRNSSPRASDVERLAAEVRALGADPLIVQNVPDAISVAIERAEESDCLLVSGSLYTVGDARPHFAEAPRPPKER